MLLCPTPTFLPLGCVSCVVASQPFASFSPVHSSDLHVVAVSSKRGLAQTPPRCLHPYMDVKHAEVAQYTDKHYHEYKVA